LWGIFLGEPHVKFEARKKGAADSPLFFLCHKSLTGFSSKSLSAQNYEEVFIMRHNQQPKQPARLLPLALGLALLAAAGCGAALPMETARPETAAQASAHYPVDITTYNYAGEEVVTRYQQAPERVLAVYQGSIETMIALGLEDKVAAAYGLDNEVKDEWKAGFAKLPYEDSVFAPDKETVLMLGPDMILSWGSYFGESAWGTWTIG
jgi:iron complex transport system substrate-binding protein